MMVVNCPENFRIKKQIYIDVTLQSQSYIFKYFFYVQYQNNYAILSPEDLKKTKNNSCIFAESAHLLWQEMEYKDWIADLEQCSRRMSSVRYDSEEAVMFGLAVVPD